MAEPQEIKNYPYRTTLVKQPPAYGGGVYAILSGQRVLYVGSSKNLQRRLNVHRHLLSNKKHYNIKLQNIYEIHSNDMDFVVLETTDELIPREIYYIRSLSPECNLDEPVSDIKLGACRETRIKMSAAKANFTPWNKGLPRSYTEKIAIKNGIRSRNPNGRKPWNLGVPHSEETKRKISATKLGAKTNG